MTDRGYGSLIASSPAWRAIVVMAQVVGALLLRETRLRFGRSQIGYLWAVLEPLGGVILFSFAFMMINKPAVVGPSLFLFFSLSMLGYNLFRRVSLQVGAALEANEALLSYPIVKPIDTFIARGLLEVATGLLSILIILAGLYVVEDIPPPASFENLAAALAVLALFGFGLGTMNAVINQYSASWRHIEGLIHRPLFLMSGVFYTPTMFPQVVVDLLAWNPIIHGIEWIRYGYYEGYRPDFISFWYITAWALGTTLLGLAGERFLPKRRQ